MSTKRIWRRDGVAGVAMLVSVGLLSAGCGGGGGSKDSAKTPISIAAPQTTPTTGKESPARRAQQRHAKRPRPGHATRSRISAKQALNQALAHLPSEKRARMAHDTAALVFRLFGVTAQNVDVTSNGEAIRATVSASDACFSTPDVENRIRARVQRVLPFVKSVEAVVSGTGQTLSNYPHSRCPSPGLPGGKGRVVLDQRGTGIVTTRTFVVRSRRWSVDYASGGKFLQIMPTKGSAATDAFTVSKPGSGRRTFSGAGTFRLRITSLAGWAVRVRDGA
jgi:hypothetical protein